MFLSVHSYFSLRYGTLSPEQLAEEAARLGIAVLPLTDINNCSAAYAFAGACEKLGIKPIYGLEFRQDHKHRFTALARNAEGIREINELLTRCSIENLEIPERAPEWQHCFVIYRKLSCPIEHLKSFEYIGIKPAEVPALFSSPCVLIWINS